MKSAAERTRIDGGVDNHVASLEPRQHQNRDERGNDREASLQRDVRDIAKRDPAATPPAAEATSSSIPSRRLIRLRPVVPAETALDVAITVTRLIAAAVLKSRPKPAFRNGTRRRRRRAEESTQAAGDDARSHDNCDSGSSQDTLDSTQCPAVL